jgi:hypothetical protein
MEPVLPADLQFENRTKAHTLVRTAVFLGERICNVCSVLDREEPLLWLASRPPEVAVECRRIWDTRQALLEATAKLPILAAAHKLPGQLSNRSPQSRKEKAPASEDRRELG